MKDFIDLGIQLCKLKPEYTIFILLAVGLVGLVFFYWAIKENIFLKDKNTELEKEKLELEKKYNDFAETISNYYKLKHQLGKLTIDLNTKTDENTQNQEKIKEILDEISQIDNQLSKKVKAIEAANESKTNRAEMIKRTKKKLYGDKNIKTNWLRNIWGKIFGFRRK